MKSYSLSDRTDQDLLYRLGRLVAHGRATTAEMLAHLAEVDDRKLYLPAGYPSMFAYCVEELRLSEETTSKRIRVARAARKFPIIFSMIADGRLHLSAVVMLHHYLTHDNAADLLAASAHRTKAEVERILADRFPRLELSSGLTEISSASTGGRPVATASALSSDEQPSPGTVVPDRARPTTAKVEPVAPHRYSLQVTIDQETHDLLRQAEDMLGHQVPSGDLGAVLRRVVELGVRQIERQKFAATDRPGSPRGSANQRLVPAHVRRAVRERDRGQCTFVSEGGHRCSARRGLEFDHALPVARGGQATMENIRLRCRAHNQFEAEREFGPEFMEHKRREAVLARKAAERTEAERRARELARCKAEEVIPWLRQLGIPADHARRAAALCEDIPNASLEERVKRALSGWVPRGTVRTPAPGAA